MTFTLVQLFLVSGVWVISLSFAFGLGMYLGTLYGKKNLYRMKTIVPQNLKESPAERLLRQRRRDYFNRGQDWEDMGDDEGGVAAR